MSASDHSFDLLECRKGWKAEEVLVVTPYVEREFFVRLAEGLRPRRLSVIIDDGCRSEDIDMVNKIISNVGGRTASGLRCVLGSAPGLMHLKLFYIVWQTPGKRTARTLIFGSANATKQGFGGSINAELIASCSLTVAHHGDIIAWCDAAIAATKSTGQAKVPAARDLELGKGSRLRLPALTVGRRKPEQASFDLWLQRGWLLSEYRPDPSFLRVPIHLGKGLSQTEQERVAATSGFFVPATKRLNFPFALPAGPESFDPDDHVDDEDGEAGNWRRRFFVWTQLGDWCSEACHKAERAHFRRKGYEGRDLRLKCLETMRSPDVLKGERARFLNSLATLWSDFGTEAAELLRGGAVLDEGYYVQLFNQRVERDLALMKDNEFRERYFSGYELTQVPRFRPDVQGWRTFVESLVRQLCLDNTRTRSQSRLLHALREAVKVVGGNTESLDNPDELLEMLRRMFLENEANDVTMAKAARMLCRYHLE